MEAQENNEIIYRKCKVYRLNGTNSLFVPLSLDWHYDYRIKSEDGLSEGDEVEIVIRKK